MNPPTCDELDDSHVFVAAQHVVSPTAAALRHPGAPTNRPAHAAATPLRHPPTLTRPRWGRELWVPDGFRCHKLIRGCDMPSGTDTTGW